MSSEVERILGIDPGLQAVGYGIIDAIDRQARLVHYGTITTTPKQPFPERLRLIHDGIADIITQYQPDRMVYEQLIYCKNVSIALSLGQARGAIIVAGARLELPMIEYSPTEIKSSIVGKGRASKEQVQKMVQILLGLEEPPQPDHAADALAAALTYVHAKKLNEILLKHTR
jgi:crossover junction endodeoxyribonuclease RuvC